MRACTVSRSSAPRGPALLVALTAACTSAPADKLAALELDDVGKAALGRLRFGRLHAGDHLLMGDLVLCGEGDRVLLGFSKPLVVDFLGRDSDWLIPELFSAASPTEVFLEVPDRQVLRLTLPRGVGGIGLHPEAWVRELKGSPLFSSDARAVGRLFEDGEQEELFALKDHPAAPGELMQRQAALPPAPPPAAGNAPTAPGPTRLPPSASPSPSAALPPGATWRLGVAVFPRMGPQRGVVIASVVLASPAAVAGLAPGDRILSVSGASVTTFQELKRRVAEARGPALALEVVRRKTGAGAAVSETVAVPLPAR